MFFICMWSILYFIWGVYVSIYDLSRRYARFCLEGVPGGLLHHYVYHLGREIGQSEAVWERGSCKSDFLLGGVRSVQEWEDQVTLSTLDWNHVPLEVSRPKKHFVYYERSVWSMPVFAEYAFRAYDLKPIAYKHIKEEVHLAIKDEEYPEVIVYFESEGKRSPLAPRSYAMLASIYEEWLADMTKRGVIVYRVPSMQGHGWQYRLTEELERICPQPPCTL